MTRVNAIMTHENPDLDATLSLWLLRRFGTQRYEGVTDAPVMFCPAGELPEGMTPEELEETRAILAVDTGGGRLDTHAREDRVADESKREKSAALLVAEDLGVAKRPELSKLLSFVTLQETKGRSIASTQPMDHLVSLPNLLRGLNICHRDSPEQVVSVMMELYDAAYATEQDWLKAKEDYKSARGLKLSNKAFIVAMVSDSTGALKVARLHKADLTVHRNLAGHTGITIRNRGKLSNLHLSRVAEVVRIAEAVRAGDPALYGRLRSIGVVHGWYLHDSGKILSKGSPKNRSMKPSQLSPGEILALTAARIDPSKPMPAEFCALARKAEEATCDTCPFAPLELKTCKGARELQ